MLSWRPCMAPIGECTFDRQTRILALRVDPSSWVKTSLRQHCLRPMAQFQREQVQPRLAEAVGRSMPTQPLAAALALRNCGDDCSWTSTRSRRRLQCFLQGSTELPLSSPCMRTLCRNRNSTKLRFVVSICCFCMAWRVTHRLHFSKISCQMC